MRSHLLSMLEPASILQVNRHTGRAPGVTPDRGQKSALRARLRMAVQALCRFSARPLSASASLVHALKERLFVVDTDFRQVLIDSFLNLVVCRHFMLLAAFLMKP